MVARAGVQPATVALGVRCSMQLSYRAIQGKKLLHLSKSALKGLGFNRAATEGQIAGFSPGEIQHTSKTGMKQPLV